MAIELPVSRIKVSARHPEDPAIVLGENGATYRMRDCAIGSIREFISHGIARSLGVQVPSSDFLITEDGALRFGSLWEADVIGTDNEEKLFRIIEEGTHAVTLSRLCALDYLTNNDDRHAGNILLRKSPFGFSIVAYDFARSSIGEIAENALAFPHDCSPTARFYDFIFAQVPFIQSAALDLLEATRSIDVSFIDYMMGIAEKIWPDEPYFDIVRGQPLHEFDRSRDARRAALTEILSSFSERKAA